METQVSFIGAELVCEEVFAKTQVKQILTKYFPANIREQMHAFGVRVYVLRDGETYNDASPVLRGLGINVDAWPVPPAGLFVVAEKTLYIRALSPMTIVHEYGHALDCTLGGGTYHSFSDEIQDAFAHASRFVTPYAATGADEYFAESVRAYVGTNDPKSPCPPATPERLKRIDPTMYSIIEKLFAIKS